MALSVILMQPSNAEENFTDINTYAKPISKKELVMLSETNGFYKIAQKMAREKKPFHSELYYMESTALPDKAAAITTLHHMSVMVEKIYQQMI